MDENPYIAPPHAAEQLGSAAKRKPISPWSWLLVALAAGSAGCLGGGYVLFLRGENYHHQAEHNEDPSRSSQMELSSTLVDGGMMMIFVGFFLGVFSVLGALVLAGRMVVAYLIRVIGRSNNATSRTT